MTTKRFALPIGEEIQYVDLPEEKILYDIHGNEATTRTDYVAEVLAAVRNPIGAPPLREVVKAGDRVCLLLSDLTRLVRTDRFLPAVLDEMNAAGVPDSDIFAIVATGTHRHHTPEENLRMYGAEVCRRIRIYPHDCRAEDLVNVGTTSRGTPVWMNARAMGADKLILTGAVSLHCFAGFGGGRKSILPGIAGLETINKNHLLSLTDEVGGGCEPTTDCGIYEGNRVSQDMTEACALVNPDFLINVVFTPEGELHEFVAGHWQKAYEKGIRDLYGMSKVPIREKADVVVFSCGGAPKDSNLYQGSKGHFNAAFALKPGGILIGAMACPDIKEPPLFSSWIAKQDLYRMELEAREDFSIPAFIAFKLKSIILGSAATYMVTLPENFEFVRRTGQIPCHTVEEAWQLAQARLREMGREDYRITVMSQASATLPVLEE